jgi:AhpD family alkylhydroperoxidase
MSMMDWNTYQKQVMSGVGELAGMSPDILKGYQAISGASRKTNLLGDKVNELISVAVAVSLRCDGCIIIHTDAAMKAGATREEIAEALGTATAMNAGATLVYATRVLDAFHSKAG